MAQDESTTIVIQGTPVEIPLTAASPAWSEGIIEAFERIAEALAATTGPFDISPTVMNIDANNVSTNVPVTDGVTSLSFPVTGVRGAFIRYTVFRSTTDPQTAVQVGTMLTVYNPNGSIGNRWQFSHDYTGGANITFNITDLGQVQFSTTTLGTGINHTGRIVFSAQAFSES